ncbi:MAG: allantoinase AllB, partial [Acidobacteria bacterium]|nr:allantoinase AllB [Acidobacteriota bacterium]
MMQTIRSKHVILPDGIRPAAFTMADGKISSVGDWDDVAGELMDAGDLVVIPGNVDAHVHVNEPGRTEWEGFATATRAAAAGGVTTIVDMPLNSIPPTTTLAGFEEKLASAEGQCTVDVAFWGGVVPGNTDELAPLVERGVRGFKCFLIHSGVDEFPHVTEDDLRIAMPEIARLDSVLLVHAETPAPIEAAAVMLADKDPRAYETFLASRPRQSENEAIELMIRLCRDTGCRVHIVHLSSGDACEMLRDSKAEGLPISAETCPHYLTFTAEEIPDRATQYKCCPPVREAENRDKLWSAIADGTIEMVVSDHSPCTPALKLLEDGDFLAAWGGISALQFGLPVMWTNLRDRGYDTADLTRLMSSAPARLAGLDHRKGKLAAGYDADLV